MLALIIVHLKVEKSLVSYMIRLMIIIKLTRKVVDLVNHESHESPESHESHESPVNHENKLYYK